MGETNKILAFDHWLFQNLPDTHQAIHESAKFIKYIDPYVAQAGRGTSEGILNFIPDTAKAIAHFPLVIKDPLDCYVFNHYRFYNHSFKACFPNLNKAIENPSTMWTINPNPKTSYLMAKTNIQTVLTMGFLTYLSKLSTAHQINKPLSKNAKPSIKKFKLKPTNTAPARIKITNGCHAIVKKRVVEVTIGTENFTIKRWVWNELEKTGNLNKQALQAVQKELSLIKRPRSNFIANRSINVQYTILNRTGFGDIFVKIEKTLKSKPRGTPVKIRIIGDGEGRLSASLAKKYGDKIDIQQVALFPAKPKNAFAYSKQTIADVTKLEAMPWANDADIIIDMYSSIFWNENNFDLLAKITNSLGKNGEMVFITKNKLFLNGETRYQHNLIPLTTGYSVDAGTFNGALLTYRNGVIKTNGLTFNIETAPILGEIFVHVVKKTNTPISAHELKTALQQASAN